MAGAFLRGIAVAQKTIYSNGSAQVSIPAGQKIAIATYGNEYATLSFRRANNLEFIRRLDNAQVVLGPYSDSRVIQIDAAQDSVFYNVGADPFVTIGRPVPLSAGITLTAESDGAQYACSTALTITIPAGLSPRPAIIVIPPPTGDASIAVSGGATINGATSTLTRARASNPAGFVVLPYEESDGYGVSGS